MTEENIKILNEKYPYVNKDIPCGHICVGNGWFVIVDELYAMINSYNKSLKEPYRIKIAQVKEKFGGLRFYIDRPEKLPELPPPDLTKSYMEQWSFVDLKELLEIRNLVFEGDWTNDSSNLSISGLMSGLHDRQRWQDRIDGAISFGEAMSYKLCESCGTTKDVECKGPEWILTLCSSCRTKRDEERQKMYGSKSQ